MDIETTRIAKIRIKTILRLKNVLKDEKDDLLNLKNFFTELPISLANEEKISPIARPKL